MLADIEKVKQIVVEAGDRALKRCGTVDCEFKADDTLVTAVDRDTERAVEDSLAKLYPGYAFLGEEYGWRGPKGAPVWACDPIDGTTNFVYGLPHWCVSVGLLSDGVPELGVIYLPRLGELFWAERGKGAFCNGVPMVVEDRDEPSQEDTVCFTSNALKTLTSEDVNGRIRSIGSIAAEVAYTCRGNLLATVGLSEGIIDVAAALCICAEVGVEFRYLRGPLVDIPALVEDRRTKEHFVYAPPRLAKHLQDNLKVRGPLLRG